jgi:hypothetical protein
MEEIKENKSIVTSYRLSQDTKDKLQQQLKDLGMTQEQYFNKAVSAMELENVKQNSFLIKDTTVIQSNLDAILNAFISIADGSNNLISNKDAEIELAKIKYKDMLLDKEVCITEQKQELQEVYSNLNVLQNLNDNNASELLSLGIEYNKKLSQMESNLADKTSLITEYKQKNDDLMSIVSEYKQYKDEVAQYKKLLAEAQARDIDNVNIIKDKDYNINALNKNIGDLKLESQKELDQLKKESELNIKLTIADVKEELNNRLNQEQAKHNKDIEEYQSKYKMLLEELEKERSIPKVKNVTGLIEDNK